MNKTARWALAIAVILPIACYYLVKGFGENATVMPRKFFVDTVIENTKDGITTFDTVWHKLPDFSFTNQLGKPVSLKELEGKILVVNTFFTRCPNICPALTRNIRKLQSSFENPKRKKYGDTSVVNFLSISIDPERDSVAALKRWSDRFFVNSDNWNLVTGNREGIYSLMLHEFKLATEYGGFVDSNFIHSEKVILLDRNQVIRGYYNGLDSAAMGALAEDIGKLYLEKDKKKPSIFREFIPLLPMLAMVPIIIILLMLILRKSRMKDEA